MFVHVCLETDVPSFPTSSIAPNKSMHDLAWHPLYRLCPTLDAELPGQATDGRRGGGLSVSRVRMRTLDGRTWIKAIGRELLHGKSKKRMNTPLGARVERKGVYLF
jgi:hypothetical protein